MRSLLLFLCLLADQSVRCLALARSRSIAKNNTQMIYLPLSTGAACLDGSPYAFQITPGPTDRWTIHLPGGGDACQTEEDCEAKATTFYGSSLTFDPELDKHGCQCRNFQRDHIKDCTCVNLIYCDGGYFSGHRDQPLETANGNKLMIRGRRNLEATLELLLADYGLADAFELYVTGHSSGGLGTVLVMDSVAAKMPSSTRVRGIPIAGYNIDNGQCCHPDKCCYRECCYNNFLSKVYSLQNMSGTLSKACTDYYAEDPWRCLLSRYAAAFVNTPMFIMNSMHDAFQLNNILGLDFSIYHKQTGVTEFLEPVRSHGVKFMEQLKPSLTDTKHAAFVTACICHAGCSLDNSFFTVNFQGDWIGLLIGQWSLALANNHGKQDEAPLYVDGYEPNYDCDVDGEVQTVPYLHKTRHTTNW